MAIRVVEYSNGGTKLERFLPKNQRPQRKLLNFENWDNGEVSKIGHHFSKQSDLKIDVIKKNSTTRTAINCKYDSDLLGFKESMLQIAVII
jgi:hypothetical protein